MSLCLSVIISKERRNYGAGWISMLGLVVCHRQFGFSLQGGNSDSFFCIWIDWCILLKLIKQCHIFVGFLNGRYCTLTYVIIRFFISPFFFLIGNFLFLFCFPLRRPLLVPTGFIRAFVSCTAYVFGRWVVAMLYGYDETDGDSLATRTR